MGTRTKRYQGGAIISFIIVAIIIAALLVGGLVWLRHRSSVAREGQIATQSEGSKAPTGVTKEGRDTQNNTKKNTNDFPASSSNSSQSEKKTDSTRSESSTATKPGETTTKPAQDEATSQTNQSTPGSLPQTGPAELIAPAVILGLIAYVVTRYAMSRRGLVRAVTAVS